MSILSRHPFRPSILKILPTAPAFRPARCIVMSAAPETNGDRAAKPKNNGGKKEIKILMLHGFTQSGPLFRAKTRAVEKMLAKVLAPISLLPVLIYPTGPNRLLASELPGYEPPADDADAGEDHQPDTWAWFRKDEASGSYRLLPEGMATVAQAMREAGGVDGICGFSQGSAMASLVTAALEPDRQLPEGEEGDWARGLRDANGGRPPKFSVLYSGFLATPESLKWCYSPPIKTPTLHYIGSLDTVVEESRSQALVDHCEQPLVVTHPGGHYVPVSKEWVMPLAGFIKQHVEDNKLEGKI